MWFKQAQYYQLSNPIEYKPEALEEQLKRLEFTPCLPSFSSGHGWASPIDLDGAPLVHSANGYLLFCLQEEEKVLPGSVIRQAVKDRVKKIAADHDRKVSSKEKTEIKEEITQTLLPRAFSKINRIYAYIDTRNNYVIVDTASAKKLELFSKMFHRSCTEHKLLPVETRKLAPVLTSWVLNHAYPKEFAVDQSGVFKDPRQQTRVVRCQQQDLSASSIHSVLKDGYEVSQLKLIWQDRLTFSLSDDFTFSNIKFHDSVIEASKAFDSETEEQRFDADFYIMTETFTEFWQDVIEEFKVPTGQNVEKETTEA